MDRISGVLPQIGWSPQLVPAAQKAAPATTVEAASVTADTAGGMSADVDTGSGADFLAQLRLLTRQGGRDGASGAQDGTDSDRSSSGTGSALAATTASALTALLQIEASPDPDAPTGPPPAFDVTPLEAHVAALRAGPVTGAGQGQAGDIATGTDAGADLAAAGAVQADPTRAAVALTNAPLSPTAPTEGSPDTVAAVVPRDAWPLAGETAGATASGSSLDVTR